MYCTTIVNDEENKADPNVIESHNLFCNHNTVPVMYSSALSPQSNFTWMPTVSSHPYIAGSSTSIMFSAICQF